ncbi:MAG: hypothetical protein ACE5JJ_10570 [Nitrospinota bacterium]
MSSEADTVARLARERMGRELPPGRADRIAGQMAKLRERIARAKANLSPFWEPSHHRALLEGEAHD